MIIPPNIYPSYQVYLSLSLSIYLSLSLSLSLSQTHAHTTHFLLFRPTHLLESHVSGQMVKKEVTEEGEVSSGYYTAELKMPKALGLYSQKSIEPFNGTLMLNSRLKAVFT